jgi:hypothetical protein
MAGGCCWYSGSPAQITTAPTLSDEATDCSYDLAAVPEDGYGVADDGGEIYLCNARCLCIWAVSLATKPGLSEELKARRLVLKVPTQEELVFETIAGLARWACSHALGVGA